MAPEIRIAGRAIGAGHPPWVIAELSANHNGSLERALAIIDAAAAAGAHAVKFQTYTPESMTLDLDREGFRIEDAASPWRGYTLWELYRDAQTPWDWHESLFERCRRHGLIPFSTPFDQTAIALLENLGTPCHKIASFENVDLDLVRAAASTGKPLIVSTGMASLEEIDQAVETARAAGCRELLLLKCTSSYPAPAGDSNLRTIPDLARRYACPVGLSDHTPGIGAAVAAVALGAAAVEKHLTLARADGGVDAAFSLEPRELAELAVEVERAWRSLGETHYGPTPSERASLRFRRSLYLVRDLPAGHVLTRDDVRSIRPGFGLAPKHIEAVLGRRLARPVERGTPLAWELLE